MPDIFVPDILVPDRRSIIRDASRIIFIIFPRWLSDMPLLRFYRLLVLPLAVLMALTGLAGPLLAQAGPQPHVLTMTVDGVINPVKERFISRAIEQAVEGDAALLVIKLDTPGGLLSSTREIVELLLESPVPVAVYVSPSGARAGSAGTFITAAANFAVMAPGSNIGAATPVSGSGQDLDETLASKVENDAAALIRSIAQERGRNADKLEATVREAASYSAREAVADGVADFIAKDMDHLLAQLHGRTAETSRGPVTLDTLGLERRAFEKSVLEQFLEFISDPNVSFLLLSIGGLGIVIELFNPGLIVPAVVGAICLLLAFLALGNLPVNWGGVVFILLAAVLAGFEVAVSGFGVLGLGAIVCLVVGGFLLFAQFGDTSPTLPQVSVNRWLIVAVAIGSGASVLYLAREAVKSRRERRADATESMVGETGAVTVALAPRGVVRVASDTWTAVSADGSHIDAGELVRVVAVEGLVLTVARREGSASDGSPRDETR